jgi:hypothetical protein
VYNRISETKLHVLLQCLPYFSFTVRNIVLQDICTVSTTYPDKRHYLHSTSTTLWYYASENTVSCVHSCQTQDVIRNKITSNLCSYIRWHRFHVSSLNMRTGNNPKNAICRLHFEINCGLREAAG